MLEITEVGSYPLKCGLLDTNDAFILDTGAGGIFAWVGRGATANEKKAAFKNATVRGVSGRVLQVESFSWQHTRGDMALTVYAL